MESKVRFVNEKLRLSFEETEKSDPRLHKEIEKAINDISNNVFCGRRVKKELIPKNLGNLNNILIYSLRKDWRLLYTIGREDVKIIAIILNWMNHKEYERLFKF